MIGKTLSHYRIVEPLGSGGMGDVYRAQDTHLGRDVAVKVLQKGALNDPVTRERFRQEAHVLSRLSHPGVATIFDFDTQEGVDFLVMEYVPGGTLEGRLAAGPLPVDEVLRLGGEIAEALANAHKQGFVHRDLKPGNVVLTAHGTPKILDFGIVGLLHETQGQTKLTQPGVVLGSLPYMAPEQLKGEPEDPRADVYALGVILYEMTAGARPFDKARPEALMFDVLHAAPPPLRALRPDAPAELERLISACLSKEAEHRPASAGDVALALGRLREQRKTGVKGEESRNVIRSLAVLPLENVSRDPAQEYFADGMTEALIGDLARLKALRVISRTSAMKYKGSTKALPEIARELNVDAILEGSALLVGLRVRINVQLVSAHSDETLWADRYDGGLEDVLDLQSRVAETVAKEIALHVSAREATHLAKRQVVNPEAHLEYLKGRHNVAATSPQAIELALRHFKRALEIEPEFAPAWAGIARCHNTRGARGMAPPAEANADALAAAQRALELDPALPDAHAALAVTMMQGRRFPEATRAFEKAIELNPGLADVYDDLGRLYYLFERHEQAQRAMLKALSLDPLSMIVHTAVGDAYYYAREYERSLVYYRKAIELDPRFDGAHTDLARSLEALGRFDEAREQYEEGRRLGGGVAGPSFGLAHLAASRGDAVEARRILAELTEARKTRVVSAWGIAVLHACLGDVDDAFRWLETAIEDGATGLMLLRVHPRVDALRKDPRYAPLVRRVGLDPEGTLSASSR